MPRLAIVVPYVVGQNEPSRPRKRLALIPDSVADQVRLYHKIFEGFFDFEESDVDADVVIRDGTPSDFGDVVISVDDFMFVYITFVDED